MKLLVLSRWDSKKVICATVWRRSFYLVVCNNIYLCEVNILVLEKDEYLKHNNYTFKVDVQVV